jgi:hypothetical protein
MVKKTPDWPVARFISQPAKCPFIILLLMPFKAFDYNHETLNICKSACK